MKYNFDEITPRRHSGCIKYDGAALMGKPEGLIPLWVADMDFPAPPEVTAEIMAAARRGIFGYNLVTDGYATAAANWFADRFGYRTERDWLVTSPGVVFALGLAIRSQTAPGEAVMIPQPVYHPFARLVTANGRKLVNNGLVYRDGRYEIDLVDFEEKIVTHAVKMFVLCSPHNPVGRVWTADELTAMGRICLKHKCLVVSDEIHCDFTWPGHRHHVFAALSPEFAQNSIICTAPSKTFNLAGLQASNIFIANKEVREKFAREKSNAGAGELNNLGLVACQAAYEHGRDWLEQLREYLGANLSLLKSALAGTKVRLIEPEGTYLAWLDFNALGLSAQDLDDLITARAGLWLDEGAKFGPGGEGFYRMNLACPKATLEQALTQLNRALKDGR
ncbi:MAG: pyridoxal phosphate-dependent aminotransferase [Candidatus Adiutrix sp.]|jgi:cystathionine beta-lyase|nr:pyridoxal phosphate-dependent aminotransferase [Candidatus Adiutrix sp.]